MINLPKLAWIRFIWWLVIGLAFYFIYGFRNSRLRAAE
jgi:APA family basic amino acid/polyamine antiporter